MVMHNAESVSAIVMDPNTGAICLLYTSARSVVASQLLLYPDLGTEAVYRLEVKDFPLLVAIDSKGNDIYELGPQSYRNK